MSLVHDTLLRPGAQWNPASFHQEERLLAVFDWLEVATGAAQLRLFAPRLSLAPRLFMAPLERMK